MGGALVCPSCGAIQEHAVAKCADCGFIGENTVSLFGLSAPPMESIVDPHELFTASEKKSLGRTISRFEKKFPQIHLTLLRTELPLRYDIKVFAFWYFNVAPLRAGEQAEDRMWSILLVQDPDNRRIAVIGGYLIEPFISSDQWEALLLTLKNEWQNAGRSNALKCFIHKLSDILQASFVDCSKKIARRT